MTENFVKMCNKVQDSDSNGAPRTASGAPIIISIRKKTNSEKGSVPESQKVISFQDKNKNNCHIPMPASVIARSQQKALPTPKKADSEKDSVPLSESEHSKNDTIPEQDNCHKTFSTSLTNSGSFEFFNCQDSHLKFSFFILYA